MEETTKERLYEMPKLDRLNFIKSKLDNIRYSDRTIQELEELFFLEENIANSREPDSEYRHQLYLTGQKFELLIIAKRKSKKQLMSSFMDALDEFKTDLLLEIGLESRVPNDEEL